SSGRMCPPGDPAGRPGCEEREQKMWFKRKPKNRRLGREHVLDVKLRSGKVRAARLRLAAVSFGVMFGALFGLYLIWRTGEWALNHFVYENKSFSIQEIQVQTDGV